jgi:hypothetical protein
MWYIPVTFSSYAIARIYETVGSVKLGKCSTIAAHSEEL